MSSTQESSLVSPSGVLRPTLILFLLLSVITGIIYPLVVLVGAQVLFPRQARGSLVEYQGRAVGSGLVGQAFQDPGLFWSRPSAIDYRSATSGGSNLSVLHPALAELVTSRVLAAQKVGLQAAGMSVPVDLVTASASGLDPHVTPASAFWQVPRVAKARNMNVAEVEAIVQDRVEDRTWGVLGEPRVNVLLLNLDLLKRSGVNP